jgi:transcriptional regulator with XRE-family HTH domain
MLSLYQNMRPSSKRTTVAVLREILGLSVEELAGLIGKSVPTVQSLESGRLKLSQETAVEISKKTGVSLKWLLDGKTRLEPYYDDGSGPKPYDLNIFEELRAAEQYGHRLFLLPDTDEGVTLDSILYALEALPIFYSALSKGEAKAMLMHYHWSNFLENMRQKFGINDRAVASILRIEIDPETKTEVMSNNTILRGIDQVKVTISDPTRTRAKKSRV